MIAGWVPFARLVCGVFCLCGSLSATAAPAEEIASLVPLQAVHAAVAEDFSRIAASANWNAKRLTLSPPSLDDSGIAEVRIVCSASPDTISIEVHAPSEEWSSAAYLGLRKLGFLFPHPRWQISPTAAEAGQHCGETHAWHPRFRYRGFHLHTMHPNEWVRGFLEGDTAIAEATVRWSARNQQNILQVVLLANSDTEEVAERLRLPFALAKQLGIHPGINVGIVQVQQMSRRLMPMFGLVFGEYFLKARLQPLIDQIDFDFLSLDFGVTEFHSTPRKLTLEWIDLVRRMLEAHGRRLFGKVHVSHPTPDPHDNYNFLIASSADSVGVLPHTVMFYGLNDPYAPVYDRQDFADMREFLLQQVSRRPTWYFPETSYWIGMDVDVPLLLTDYLSARSVDMDYVEDHGAQGHLTFSSGQELGYWLFDWTVALLSDAANRGDPLVGIKLLQEDSRVWTRILDFQHRHFKQGQLIQQLSSANILDELPAPVRHSVHKRNTLADLYSDPVALANEIGQLEQARSEAPPLSEVKNAELRRLLEVTWARIDHAYWLRRAMQSDSATRLADLAQARGVRELALAKMQQVQSGYNRYPEAGLFELRCTPTSYAFGTLWPSVTLHFWEREEAMVGVGRMFPPVYFSMLYKNIWNPFAILFDIPSPYCWFQY
jgi:hypothetical protein